jgi:hypothetical protein
VLLVGYAVVYCLPCLILLLVGQLWGHEVRDRLGGIYRRFGAAREVPRSVGLALTCGAGAVALAGLAGLAASV